jgi:hypothetical protein
MRFASCVSIVSADPCATCWKPLTSSKPVASDWFRLKRRSIRHLPPANSSFMYLARSRTAKDDSSPNVHATARSGCRQWQAPGAKVIRPGEAGSSVHIGRRRFVANQGSIPSWDRALDPLRSPCSPHCLRSRHAKFYGDPWAGHPLTVNFRTDAASTPVTGYCAPESIAGAALLPLTGCADHRANVPHALAATGRNHA